MSDDDADSGSSGLVSTVSLDEYGTVTEAVVTTIATIEGVTTHELPPLRTYLDADALDNLFARRRQATESKVRIGFIYLDYEVVVTGDGDLTVFELDGVERGGRVGPGVESTAAASRIADTVYDAPSDENE
ncbi:HalOD1 output domain-containing protein [Haloprofundus halobius]|uniref:HalOD1 output domain-containing protein n=1 Tax=Haloprofundus halobius TaxID=2876194 RepID=UPI001CCDCEB7|nr:HalOD1 output domain-containing protein [Haloprofundus halobius]